jgi:DNA-binding MarR family transcriptional regulator
MRCVDFLDLQGPLTAGQLAEATGLTTGAMTTVLDRLERSGIARRARDSTDKRRVLVELAPGVREQAAQFYGEHLAMSERLYHRYTEAQLDLLLEFVRGGREFNEHRAAEVESENRARGPRSR